MKVFNIEKNIELIQMQPFESGTACLLHINISGSYEIICHEGLPMKLFHRTKGLMARSGEKNGGASFMARTLIGGEAYCLEIEGRAGHPLSQFVFLSMRRMAEPRHKYFKHQWALLNKQTGEDINVLPAWQYTKGEGVTIAVVDTGINYKHLNLKDAVHLGESYNFLHDLKEIMPKGERSSNGGGSVHGSHIAGVIGASQHFEEGIIGVAPQAKIVSFKVLGEPISNHKIYRQATEAFINSIAYAKDHHIKIINCSFGGLVPSPEEKKAMEEAKDLLFVIAAGNRGLDLGLAKQYPAGYGLSNSIVVAATNHMGELFEGSNYGEGVDIGAPGYKILSTHLDQDYIVASATSVAAGFVSGVCGLLLSINPSLSPLDIKERLMSSDSVTSSDSLKGKVACSGIVNAYASIQNEIEDLKGGAYVR